MDSFIPLNITDIFICTNFQMQNNIIILVVSISLLGSPSFLSLSSGPRGQSVYQLLQRCQLLLINQFELLDEVDKMFERCVEMSFLAERHNLLQHTTIEGKLSNN